MNDETLPLDRPPSAGKTPVPGSAPSRPPGTLLGQYRLVRLIASGGMGEVYEAIQLSLDRRVALKLIAPHLTSQPEFLQRFEREAKSAAMLNHPNIVQVYDFGCADGQHYLAMEFVDGSDVSELLRARGKLGVEEALQIIEQTAAALNAAHQQRIIHRDIKPANLLVTKSGLIKVSDLGLAKRLDEASEMTLTGAGIGSPHFLAPEQASDASTVDHRADIYSLGITLLYLLTGKRPFERSSAFSVVLAHVQQPLPTGAELGAPLPDGVETLIRKMAAKKREDRYPTYDELLADIARLKQGQAPIARPPSKPSRKAPIIAAVAALVVVALAFIFFRKEPAVANNSQQLPAENPPERRPPPRDDRGPAMRGGPGGPGMRQGGRFPLPMGPPGRPEREAIPVGPIPQMLEAADKFARENPNLFRPIVHRYQQVAEQARGTSFEGQAEDKLDAARAAMDAAATKAVNDFTARMNQLVREAKPQQAYDVWRDFPEPLRTFETDRAIEARLAEALPPDFFPARDRP